MSETRSVFDWTFHTSVSPLCGKNGPSNFQIVWMETSNYWFMVRYHRSRKTNSCPRIWFQKPLRLTVVPILLLCVEHPIEPLSVTSRPPSWSLKAVLFELNYFLMWTLSFVAINLHGCQPREWKRPIADRQSEKSANVNAKQTRCQVSLLLVPRPFVSLPP